MTTRRDPRLLAAAIVSGVLLWGVAGCGHTHDREAGTKMSNLLGTAKGAAIGVIMALVMAVLYLSGCATQTGLLSPGVERVCTKGVCFLRASSDIVDRRCRDGNRGTWDDGTPRAAGDGRRARCCTVFTRGRKRFRIWVAEGDESCVPHEFCHVEESLSARPNHGNCHDFGFGREKKRL